MKGKVAIVGAGMSNFGERFDASYEQLIQEAYLRAMASVDRGFDPDRIEAGWLSTVLGSLSEGSEFVTGGRLAQAIGLYGRPVTRVENACATGADAVRNAAFAVAAGVYDVVVVVGAEKMRDGPSDEYLRVRRPVSAAMTAPGMFALYANRYAAEYGDPREAMTAISIKNHHNGRLCPYSHMKIEVTPESILASPMVSEPFHLLDCCPQTDGAAALILCNASIAHEFTDAPVYIWGTGVGVDSFDLKEHDSFTSARATREAAAQAYRMAGIGPDDVQVAEVHDCFSFAEILDYEDLGFAERGAGRALALSGETGLEGSKPVNPSGGLLAKGHPLGATGVAQMVELWWQLRRQTEETGARQVRAADVALQQNVGGPVSVAAVTILSNRPGE